MLLPLFYERVDKSKTSAQSQSYSFDTLEVYGAQLRQLAEEDPKGLQFLHERFKIVVQENDLEILEGLPFEGLITDGLVE